jgi:hypothetical protein
MTQQKPTSALDQIADPELPEVMRVASELYARDQAEMEKAKQRQEMLHAAVEAGIPAEYLERAAATLHARRSDKKDCRRGGSSAFRVLAIVVAAMLFSRAMARLTHHGMPPPPPFMTALMPPDPPPPAAPAVISPIGPTAAVELGQSVNHSLDEGMLETPGNNLADLGAGTHLLNGVPFRVSGVVMVGPGATSNGDTDEQVSLPRQVEGIPIGCKASRLFFLHGTHWWTDDGTRIASYLVHYADGSTVEIPVVYGRDVLDWWMHSGQSGEPAERHVAWVGRNDAAENAGMPIRLYMKAWENPSPEVPIRSVDMVTGDQAPGHGAPAPFLVGLTVETAKPATEGPEPPPSADAPVTGGDRDPGKG